MTGPLSIIVVDDHHLFLKGVKEHLAELPFVKEIKTCLSYSEFIKAFQETIPDVVFLDLNLPSYNGLSICEEIKRNHPETIIAILTQYDSDMFVQKAKKCGADAYFIKNTDPEILSYYLQSLIQGDIKGFFAHVPSAPKTNPFFETDEFELKEHLTPREHEVLKMIVKGINREEIEKTLGIANPTYKIHKANIMRKLKIQNDIEFGVFAVKHRLREI